MEEALAGEANDDGADDPKEQAVKEGAAHI